MKAKSILLFIKSSFFLKLFLVKYFKGQEIMNMQEIRSLAKSHGVKSSRLSKVKLVQAIQNTEGNFDCFATATDAYCDQLDCIWREDCFESAKKLKQ